MTDTEKTKPPSAFLTDAQRAQIASQAGREATAALRAEVIKVTAASTKISGFDASIAAAAGEGDAALVASLVSERDAVQAETNAPVEAWYEGSAFQKSIKDHESNWSWYGVDAAATEKANEVGNMLRPSKFSSEAEFFAEVEKAALGKEETKEVQTVPGHPNVAVPGAAAVSTAPTAPNAPKDPSEFKDLDSAQKDIFNQFVSSLGIEDGDKDGLEDAKGMFMASIGTYDDSREDA